MTSGETATIRRARPEDVPAMCAMVHELAAYEKAPELCRLTEDRLRDSLFGEHAAVYGHVAVTTKEEPGQGGPRAVTTKEEPGQGGPRAVTTQEEPGPGGPRAVTTQEEPGPGGPRAVTTKEEPGQGGPRAQAGGEVVGMAIWFLNYSTWDGVHGIYLEDLYVRPEHRGAGLGKALLAELAKECARNGWTRLSWWVLDWNAPAIGFYQSIGAKPQHEWTTYRLSGPELAALAESGSPRTKPC